jgi:hypothetical protein
MKILLSHRNFPTSTAAQAAMTYVFQQFAMLERTHPRVWNMLNLSVEDPAPGLLTMPARQLQARLYIRLICTEAAGRFAPAYYSDGMEPRVEFELVSDYTRPAMSYDEALRIMRTPITGHCGCDTFFGLTCRFCEAHERHEEAMDLIATASETMVDSEIQELVAA